MDGSGNKLSSERAQGLKGEEGSKRWVHGMAGARISVLECGRGEGKRS